MKSERLLGLAKRVVLIGAIPLVGCICDPSGSLSADGIRVTPATGQSFENVRTRVLEIVDAKGLPVCRIASTEGGVRFVLGGVPSGGPGGIVLPEAELEVVNIPGIESVSLVLRGTRRDLPEGKARAFTIEAKVIGHTGWIAVSGPEATHLKIGEEEIEVRGRKDGETRRLPK